MYVLREVKKIENKNDLSKIQYGKSCDYVNINNKKS